MIDPWPIGETAVVVGLMFATGLASAFSRMGLIELPPAASRLGSIDGLRGYLALAVAAHHLLVGMNARLTGFVEAPSSHIFNNLGQAGVAIFFMITGALFYAKAFRTPLRSGWLKLYTGRVFRLCPLLFVIAASVHIWALMAFGSPVDGGILRLVYSTLRWTAVLGPSNKIGPAAETAYNIAGVLWTLRYEVIFYASLPVLALLSAAASLMNANHWSFLVGLLIAASTMSGWAVGGYQFLFGVLFVLGAIAYEISLNGRLKPVLQSSLAAILGAVALLTELTVFPSSFGILQFFLLAAFFTPVICGNSYFGVLSTRGALVLGELSYGIYLWHPVVLAPFTEWLDVRPPVAWYLLPLIFWIIMCVSLATFRLVEQPGIRLGRKLARTLFQSREERSLA
jgi:peptidoglycan/LPS O-acetylase OafA/YrhL